MLHALDRTLTTTQAEHNVFSNERITTFNAGVGGLKVRGEVSWTRLHTVDRRIWNDELTSTSTGAASVEDATDVSGTAKMTVTASDAATELHTTVTRLVDQHHLTLSTRGIEHFHVTVFRRHCTHDIDSYQLELQMAAISSYFCRTRVNISNVGGHYCHRLQFDI